MGIFEIVLIIIGSLLIFISYILSEKLAGNKLKENEQLLFNMNTEITEEIEQQKKTMREEFQNLLEDKRETLLLFIEDELSRLSNEKIMAVSEYSDQVLEKIAQNHSEVVFLYDMLKERETDIKKLIQELESNKGELNKLQTQLLEFVKEIKAQKEQLETMKSAKIKTNSISVPAVDSMLQSSNTGVLSGIDLLKKGKQKQVEELKTKKETKEKKIRKEEQILQKGNKEHSEDKVSSPKVVSIEKKTTVSANNNIIADKINSVEEIVHKETFINQDQNKEFLKETSSNNNEQILKLYEEGKSVLEISKQLGIGQGEVKLVIDLFRGGRRGR